MKRLQYLDSLRGIACLYVVAFHMALVPKPALVLPEWAKPIILFGGSGVTLFFVISAFSLSMTMPRHEQAGGVVNYYFSRFFRIAPLFYVLIIFTYLRDIVVFGVYHGLGKVLLSVFFLFNFVPGRQEGFVWASWTIGVEMIFYVIFPFIYLRASTLTKKLTALFVSIGIYFIYPHVLTVMSLTPEQIAGFQSFSLAQHLPVFIIGMIAFELQPLLRDRPNAKSIGMTLAVAGIVGILGIIVGKITPIIVDFRHQLAFFYAALLLGLSLCPWALFVNKVTQFYGEISYSVYLWHAPIVFALNPTYRMIYGFGFLKTLSLLLAVAVTLAVVTPIGYLSYRWIEIPGMKFGKRLFGKTFGRNNKVQLSHA